MSRLGIAEWIGPTVNEGDGDGKPGEPEDRMRAHLGVVLHIQEGSEAGTEAWMRNPAADVSSHLLAPKAGGLRQMVDLDDRSWCQSAGNATWISLECEGRAGDALTAGQVEAAAQALAFTHRTWGVPLVASDSPATPGLGWHGMGGAAWGGHTGCPGSRIVAQRGDIIARAQQIINGGDDMPETVAGEPLGTYLTRVERGLWWPIPGIAKTLDQLAADSRARDAAEATAVAGLRVVVDALAKALAAAGTGTPLDTAAVLARVDQRAAEVRAAVERDHAAVVAGLRAELAALTAASVA